MIVKIYLLGLLSVLCVDSFNVEIQESKIRLTSGDTLHLQCKSDSAYEYCMFSAPLGDQCKYEWKRADWNITRQECDAGLEARTVFTGDYDDHECSVSVGEVSPADAGLWRCRLESYVYGHTRGTVRISEIEVEVTIPTTTTTTTTTTTVKAREGRGLVYEIEDRRVDEEVKVGASSQFLKSGVFPVTMVMVMSLLTLMVISTIILATKLSKKKKTKKYEVSDSETASANIPDKKIIQIEEVATEEDTSGDLKNDNEYLHEIFPHLINFPQNSDQNQSKPPGAGPGLVGLSYV